MIKKLILDKVRWARGDDCGSARLLGEDGKMCCLGYCMAQEGIQAPLLLDMGEPQEVYDYYESSMAGKILPYLVEGAEPDPSDEFCEIKYSATPFTAKAIRINDDASISDEERVIRLTELFGSIGIEVVLVDTPEQVAELGGVPVEFGKP